MSTRKMLKRLSLLGYTVMFAPSEAMDEVDAEAFWCTAWKEDAVTQSTFAADPQDALRFVYQAVTWQEREQP